ncbi:hypothetical protein NSS79_19685 [Paenibacillus sp. FSL L8-0436]|uniref:hypothetical protein n=1 Tax=Paenibacillus sp. FSL L8-0436 TaxID=2954686 RepID=UPI0031590D23
MNQVQIYNAPNNIPLREDFRVKVRPVGGEWQPLLIYEVKVDMHQVRPASLAFFDLQGVAEVEITCLYTEITHVNIAPAARNIKFEQDGRKHSILHQALITSKKRHFRCPQERPYILPEGQS